MSNNVQLPFLSKNLNEYIDELCILYNPDSIKQSKYKKFNIFFNSMTNDKYPYIRITNYSHMSYTKSCRISLIEPKYIKANDDPYDNWIFTEQEKIDFINMLKDNVYNVLSNIGDSFKDLSMWQYILQCYNFQIDDNKFTKTTPMPNYYLL